MVISSFYACAPLDQKRMTGSLPACMPRAAFTRCRRYGKRSLMSQQWHATNSFTEGRGAMRGAQGHFPVNPDARAVTLNTPCPRRKALQDRTADGYHRESMRRETLIREAETTLAWQTPATFRKWFNHWRSRGIVVNDLLNMTWVWHQRAVTW
jgi:hypothetical protein